MHQNPSSSTKYNTLLLEDLSAYQYISGIEKNVPEFNLQNNPTSQSN